MMLASIVLLPALLGLAAFFVRPDRVRRTILLAGAAAHAALTAGAAYARPAPAWGGGLALDDLGLVFLGLVSLLFLAAAVYAIGWLRRGASVSDRTEEDDEAFLFSAAPEAVFTGALLLFLSTMSLVTMAHHFGLLWVAIEATTLASAPLIFHHRQARSLEAAWKYLLICSVGIALALLGNFFLAVAAEARTAGAVPLRLSDLLCDAARLDPTWLKLALIFFFVGYGTKMGLAPLHTWLPDAHSEAPSLVSALLSGALLNCAFLGLLRIGQVCRAAGLGDETNDLFVVFGLISIFAAAVFLLRQTDFKRMLAYSSVEHMGILSLGAGLAGRGLYGALLHAVNHSLVKAALFLLAGNLLAVFGAKSIETVRGALRRCPATGRLWLAGFLAITGTPPFGLFVSKLTVLEAALDGRHWMMAAAFLVAVAAVFLAMSAAVFRMVFGSGAPENPPSPVRPPGICMLAPPALLLGVSLGLGLHLPGPVARLLEQAARTAGGLP